MSSGLKSMDELNALMEERARYEQWLEQLSERKGSTPPHVFERVRGDYGERLNRVLDQLAGRSTELQATAGTLADRVAALFADETALRDERAEAELRAAVGEFTEERAREVVQRCDEGIASLGAERASVGAELGRVQEILAVATRPPTPPAGEPNVVPIEALAPPAPLPSSNGAEPARPTQPPARREAVPSQFDELAFLQSVVDKPAPPAAPALPADMAPTDTRAERPAPAPSRAPMRDDAPQPAPEPVAAAPSRRAAAPTPILTSAPLIEKDGHEANAALTPGSIPAFLKDVPTEQIKTLKCQECGTMNYPTEWYCERCGGELAAM
jgi:hypothetical protein